MSRKSFCYKTLETYDKPRDQLKSFCKSGGNSGYYNISSTRGICNDGECKVKENFQPLPATAWQQPARRIRCSAELGCCCLGSNISAMQQIRGQIRGQHRDHHHRTIRPIRRYFALDQMYVAIVNVLRQAQQVEDVASLTHHSPAARPNVCQRATRKQTPKRDVRLWTSTSRSRTKVTVPLINGAWPQHLHHHYEN